MNYNWDIWQWIQQQVPDALRRIAALHWLYALLRPVRYLHAIFGPFRTQSRYQATLNGRVMTMQAHLNGLATGAGTIFVRDPQTQRARLTTWLVAEQQPLPALYLVSEIPPGEAVPVYTAEEYAGDVDFEVWLPLGYTPTAQLTASVNSLKFASKRWQYRYSGTI